MAKTVGPQSIDIALSEGIQDLIARKVKSLRREQLELMATATQRAYEKLHEEILANISGPKRPKIYSSISLAVFQDIALTATAITRRWPSIVWDCITSMLTKAQLSYDCIALNALMDQFAWEKEQTPFTDDYVNPDHFRESVYRALSGRGGATRRLQGIIK